jgi:hypothetical protein
MSATAAKDIEQKKSTGCDRLDAAGKYLPEPTRMIPANRLSAPIRSNRPCPLSLPCGNLDNRLI